MSLLRFTISFVVVGVATELLPVLFGTGASASWDWSFLYITLRFVLLPVVAVVLVVSAAVLLVRSWKVRRGHVLRDAVASATVAGAFLIASYFVPLPWLDAFR